MIVQLDLSCTTHELDLQRHETFAYNLLEAAQEFNAELSISLMDDRTIQELNHQYLNKDYPTDVLSFSLREGETVGQGDPLGDIVISVDTAAQQAADYGHGLDDEIDELLFHGFIHLLGANHDEETGEDWFRIQSRLKTALEAMPSVYQPKGINCKHPESQEKKGGM
ncbi:rRNA maturation RNase YbeY [bacterium]|nr:rRNA maturation RNase YbeY [bacterium]